jgi:hypothetical protein
MTACTSGPLPAFGYGQNRASTSLLQKPQSVLRANSTERIVALQYRKNKKSNTRTRNKNNPAHIRKNLKNAQQH